MDETAPPATVREFADGVLSAEEGERYEQTFEEESVEVPSRFDRESPTATWRFDGRLTVTVHSVGN